MMDAMQCTAMHCSASNAHGHTLQCKTLDLLLFRYWTLNDVQPDKWMPLQNLLPSDCSKRLDLQTLLSGDIVAAQDMKVELENLQRSDAKIRKAAGSVG